MDYDGGEDIGSEIPESTDDIESVENNVETETTPDKGTELVTTTETDITGKGTELVDNNSSVSLSKSTELCESGEKLENVPLVTKNDKGEMLEWAPIIRDVSYIQKDENGNYVFDRNGCPKPDWEQQAPNGGFKEAPEELDKNYTLTKGTVISRYGAETGITFSDQGIPYSQRSLPYDQDSIQYHEYIVNKDIVCTKGTAAPAFNQEGGGAQYETNDSVSDLIKSGALIRIR